MSVFFLLLSGMITMTSIKRPTFDHQIVPEIASAVARCQPGEGGEWRVIFLANKFLWGLKTFLSDKLYQMGLEFAIQPLNLPGLRLLISYTRFLDGLGIEFAMTQMEGLPSLSKKRISQPESQASNQTIRPWGPQQNAFRAQFFLGTTKKITTEIHQNPTKSEFPSKNCRNTTLL